MGYEDTGSNAQTKVPPHFCRLDEISALSAYMGAEVAEMPCDEESAAVVEGIVVKLQHAPGGVCPECGLMLRKIGTIRDAAVCRHCGTYYTTVQSATPRWIVSDIGMANFVARQVAHGWAQSAGVVSHLGLVRRRQLFFSIAPPEQFFNSHGSNDSLIVGNVNAHIPPGWKGNIAFFCELFYYRDNEIRVAPDVLNALLPPAGRRLARGTHRIIHERRDQWLSFLMNFFLRPYNQRDFYKGMIRPGVVCDWFRRNVHGAPACSKTYRRDYIRFSTFQDGEDEIDYRESVIVMLLRCAADPNFSRRAETAKAISELLIQLKKGEKEHGHAIEIADCKWQFTGDGSNSRELTAVSGYADPIDDLLL